MQHWSKYFDKKAASPPHMDDSDVFSRWRQCAPTAPPSNMCFLGLIQVHIPNSISIRSAVFAQLPAVSLYFTMGHLSPLKITLLHERSGPPSNTSFIPQAHPSPQPKWHLDRFSIFCRVRNFDTLTDHSGPSVTIGHI